MRCKRCGSCSVIKEPQGSSVCLSCGQDQDDLVPVVPPNLKRGRFDEMEEKPRRRRGGGRYVQKHKYILEHKDEIIADLYALGVRETAKKHNLGYSSFYGTAGFLADWGVDKRRIPRKMKGRHEMKGKLPPPNPPPVEKSKAWRLLSCGHFQLTIGEEELASMTDEEFDEFWGWLGKAIRRRSLTIKH